MGQAKLKRLGAIRTFTADDAAAAVAKASVAYAAHPARNDFGVIGACVLRAHLVVEALRDAGFPARLVGGHHCMRVGPGDGDVVGFGDFTSLTYGNGGFRGHAWAEVDRKIIDPSTYTYPAALAEMDAMDGRRSDGKWSPAFLFADKGETRDPHRVRQSYRFCFAYEADASVTAAAHRIVDTVILAKAAA
jgi:hypothetical protein